MFFVKLNNEYIIEVFTESCFTEFPSDIIPADFENNHVLNDVDFTKFKYKVDGNNILLEEIPQNIILTKHEQTTEDIKVQGIQIQDDTLLNIELGADTNALVKTTGDDSLLLMELLMEIDSKLIQLLQPKA